MKLKPLMRAAMARPKSAFRVSDVARAIKGVAAGGLLVSSVLITPNGSIQIHTTLGAHSGHAQVPSASADDHDDPTEDELALLQELEAMKRTS